MNVKDIIETIAEKTEMIELLREEINELKEEYNRRMEKKWASAWPQRRA
jgi:FtsZ-binding cell division protein ZapB